VDAGAVETGLRKVNAEVGYCRAVTTVEGLRAAQKDCSPVYFARPVFTQLSTIHRWRPASLKISGQTLLMSKLNPGSTAINEGANLLLQLLQNIPGWEGPSKTEFDMRLRD